MIAETGKGLFGLVPKFWHAKVLASQIMGKKTCPHFSRENVRDGQILAPNQIVVKILACQNFGMPKFWYQSKQTLNDESPLKD